MVNGVPFDFDGNGVAEQMNWISPHEGFLVFDRNGNGTIDNGTELFGTYSILKDLAKRGVANEVTKNKKKYYSVISPKKLVKRQQEKYEKIKEALPELMAVTNEYAHKPKVYFYEWLDGVRELYEDTLQYPDCEILTFSSKPSSLTELDEYISHEYKKKRIDRKIFLKSIYPHKDKFMAKDKENHRQTLFYNNKHFDFKSDIGLYGWERVYLVSNNPGSISGVILENKDLYNSLKSLFDIIWTANDED